jgi:hypothetical protein
VHLRTYASQVARLDPGEIDRITKAIGTIRKIALDKRCVRYEGRRTHGRGLYILHNGIPRTYRDVKAKAFDAARLAKARRPADLIEIVDPATGEKLLMLQDGRTG